MGFPSLENFADGYQGYLQGEKTELARQQGLKDQAYTNEQRAFQASQQRRTQDEQSRADQLRLDNAAIPLTRTQSQVTNPDRGLYLPLVDDNGEPSAAQLEVRGPETTRKATESEVYRDMAKNHQKAGDVANYLRYTSMADKSDWDNSAKAISEIEATSTGKNLKDVMAQVGQVFTNDPYAGKVENIKQNPDGTVSFDAINQSTNQRVKRTVNSTAQLFDTLRAHYSPDSWEALRAAKAKHLMEMENEAFKAGVKGNEDRKTEGVKNQGAIGLENIKSGHKLSQIKTEKSMEGGNAISLENVKQLAPRQLSTGMSLAIPQKNKDGSITYVTAAENKDQKTAPAATDSQMSAIAIANYGTLDPGTGRMAGNQKTGRIAAAARVIQKANPGLDANQAIEAAAREINKPAGAK